MLYFTAHDGEGGFELWKSDGTEVGTVPLEDLTGDSASANPREITFIDGKLFVLGDNDVFGTELWHGTLGSLPGDFDRNGLLETGDIDSLVSAIAGGDHPLEFDLSNEGQVTMRDLDLWRELAGTANLGTGRVYSPGDSNLDGAVDGSDLGRWNANKFTSVAAWSRGDFNADGAIDGSDFSIWNTFKFTSSDDTGRFCGSCSSIELIRATVGPFAETGARGARGARQGEPDDVWGVLSRWRFELPLAVS